MGVAAACGSSKKGSSGQSSGSTTSGPTGATGGNLAALLPLFDLNSLRIGVPQRFVFGLGDDQGVVLTSGPATLSIEFLDANNAPLGPAISAVRHNQAIPRAYWPVTTTIPKFGTYTARAVVGTQNLDQAIQITANSSVPAAGDKLPALDTPTTKNAQGVQQVCTRDPVCPLHDISLRDALALGKPVAFIVGTPAYCQTGVCGPVLEVLLGEYAKRKGTMHFLHAEVYKEVYKDQNTPASPTVDALTLTFEPALFLAGADGVIRERLDILYDAAELGPALDRLTA